MKKQNSRIKHFALKTICKLAERTAVNSANTACSFYHHQSIVPAEVKKLRKF